MLEELTGDLGRVLRILMIVGYIVMAGLIFGIEYYGYKKYVKERIKYDKYLYVIVTISLIYVLIFIFNLFFVRKPQETRRSPTEILKIF